jgi:hypothetical protein
MTVEHNIPLFIRRVMPDATEAALQEATETFMRYMRIVIGIHERIEREKAACDSHESDSCARVAS